MHKIRDVKGGGGWRQKSLPLPEQVKLGAEHQSKNIVIMIIIKIKQKYSFR